VRRYRRPGEKPARKVSETRICRFALLDISDRAYFIDMPRALAHAAAKRELVAVQRPIDWEPPSIFRPPEVVTESELSKAEAELKALQLHAFEIVNPEIG